MESRSWNRNVGDCISNFEDKDSNNNNLVWNLDFEAVRRISKIFDKLQSIDKYRVFRIGLSIPPLGRIALNLQGNDKCTSTSMKIHSGCEELIRSAAFVQPAFPKGN